MRRGYTDFEIHPEILNWIHLLFDASGGFRTRPYGAIIEDMR
jgi:hypothetical protein